MDEKNYIYLKNKVEKYNKLECFKEQLVEIQNLLVKDGDVIIQVKDEDDYISLREQPPYVYMNTDERKDLMREIKDNLIDSIGMKIVEINDKMQEL